MAHFIVELGERKLYDKQLPFRVHGSTVLEYRSAAIGNGWLCGLSGGFSLGWEKPYLTLRVFFYSTVSLVRGEIAVASRTQPGKLWIKRLERRWRGKDHANQAARWADNLVWLFLAKYHPERVMKHGTCKWLRQWSEPRTYGQEFMAECVCKREDAQVDQEGQAQCAGCPAFELVRS